MSRTGGDDEEMTALEEETLLEDARDEARSAQVDFPVEDDDGEQEEDINEARESTLKRLERDLRLNQLRLQYARVGHALMSRRMHVVTMFLVVEAAMLVLVLMSIWAPNALPWTVTSFFTQPSMIGLIPVWLTFPLVVIQAQNFVHPRSPYIPFVFGYVLLAFLFLILEMVLVIIENVNTFGDNNVLATVDVRTIVGLIVSLIGVVLAAVFYLLGIVDEIDLIISYGKNIRARGNGTHHNWYTRAEDAITRRAAPITKRIARLFGDPVIASRRAPTRAIPMRVIAPRQRIAATMAAQAPVDSVHKYGKRGKPVRGYGGGSNSH